MKTVEQLISLIEEEKYTKAVELLNTQQQYDDDKLKWNHNEFDKVIDVIIESLDADEPDTFTLLNRSIPEYGSMEYLINATEEEKKLYGIHNSRSPFDKLLDYYLSLDDDEPKEKRFIKGVLDLIRANIRFGSIHIFVDYHDLYSNKEPKEE